MTKPKLYYFDAPVSRGEECRLALHLAGVDFEDVRIQSIQWPELKPQTPFGSLPYLELPGKPAIAHSNAILVYVGRSYNLHPSDPFEAAQHEALMCHVEDLRANVSPTLRIKDEAEKKKARELLAEMYLPSWAANTEKHLGPGPFVAGEKIHVVDIKLHMAVRWFAGGKVDYVPATIFSDYPKLMALYNAVQDHPRIQSWYAR